MGTIGAKMQVFSNPHLSLALPPGHRFPMSKYLLLHGRVAAEIPGLRLQTAEPASEGELALAHNPDYISAVLHGTLSAAAPREIGFPWSAAIGSRRPVWPRDRT